MSIRNLKYYEGCIDCKYLFNDDLILWGTCLKGIEEPPL